LTDGWVDGGIEGRGAYLGYIIGSNWGIALPCEVLRTTDCVPYFFIFPPFHQYFTLFTSHVTCLISTKTQICIYTPVPLLGYKVFIVDLLYKQTENEILE
jgi:hypothetical protein